MNNVSGIFPVSGRRERPNWLGILGILYGFLILMVILFVMALLKEFPILEADL